MKLVVAAAALLLAACPRVSAPVERPRVALQAIDDVGGALELRLRVTNANHVSVTVRAIDWRLALDGGVVRRGRAHFERRIAPGEAAILPVPTGVAATRGSYALRAVVHAFSDAGDAAEVIDVEGDLDRDLGR